MSSGDGRKVSCEDIQMVQNRIEQCLRQYMSRKEVVNTLFIQDNIEPRFTELVWQKLEEENQDFFQAYYLKLMVKEQIIEFNRLLAEQVKMTQQVPSAIGSLPMSNGCNISPSIVSSTTPHSSDQHPSLFNITPLCFNRFFLQRLWRHLAYLGSNVFLSGNHWNHCTFFQVNVLAMLHLYMVTVPVAPCHFSITIARAPCFYLLDISCFCTFLAIVSATTFAARLQRPELFHPAFLVVSGVIYLVCMFANKQAQVVFPILSFGGHVRMISISIRIVLAELCY
ncbi:uncharacterized protein [Nicotiana tomentosiformis]|uniref:uncharacterized protein isoform X2 n=1 Tax=Nicotiana tomentosiformis TaxID=4098 RepID=UPI00051C38A1|nr:uncharacterized protein LOC104107352 isoform X2 [Nicotiana tomentosiformis]